MYDISFVIPVSCKVVEDHPNMCAWAGGARVKRVDYSERLQFFKQYGLINIKDAKVKIFLLVGDENISDVEEEWDCDVEVIRDNSTYGCQRVCANKVHHFYASLTERRINESRWFMQVDDDSITNVNDLVNRLDSDYDYLDKYNISNINPFSDMYLSEYSPIFFKVIKETSYRDLISDKSTRRDIPHGWENTIFSNGALMHFISNPNNKYILEKTLLSEKLFPGDMLVPLCAALCDIPFYEVDYLEYRPYFSRLVNKEIFHIHYIYREIGHISQMRLSKLLVEK